MFDFFRHKIVVRLIVIIVTVVSIVTIGSTIYFRQSNTQIFRQFLDNTVVDTVQFAQLGYSWPVWNFDIETIERLNEAILNNPMFMAVNVYNSEHELMSGLKKDPTKKGRAVMPILGEPFTIQEGDKTLKKVSKTIEHYGANIGTFEIFYTEDIIEAAIHQGTIRIMLAFGLIAMGIIVTIFVGIRRLAIKPILTLAEVSQEVAKSNDYSIRVEKTSEDEIGFLYDGFNDMLYQIHKREMERDQAVMELKQAENLLSNVINSMPSMLISINEEGVISQWNEAAVQKTGIVATRAIGKDLWEIAPLFQSYQKHYNEVIERCEPQEFYRETLDNKEDAHAFYNVLLFPLISNGSKGMVMRVDDITEIEEKEEQLRQAQKMESVGTLAGGLAHDFNNMLGGITGSLSLIKHKLEQDNQIQSEDLSRYLGVMDGAADRAIDMVQQLLTLSRKHELSFAPVDLNLTIKHIVKICANTFDKCIELIPVYTDDRAMVNGDPTQLEQVLLNLCINASHAMTIMREEEKALGGKLRLDLKAIRVDRHFRATHPEAADIDYWRLSVRDTGVGMDKKTVAKIFDPFFTTKEKGKGTGLGLAVAYNIIKQHNGFVDVYSEQGLGTTFNVFLPVKDGVEVSEFMAEEELPRGSGLILVVDDEEMIRQVAQSILVECGYEVIFARDGVEGIEIFKQSHTEINAILLDMVMPRMAGKETYIEMRKIDPGLKVLLASGFKQDERVKAVLGMGVQGFIQKPYTLQSLAVAIDRIIKG